MTRRKTRRLEKGIRPWKGGLQGYIKVRGVQYAKHYPLDEPLENIRVWREGLKIDDAFRQQKAAIEAKILPRSVTGWCYVYFARSGGVVKIGRAADPAVRLREIQTMHPGELELLAAVPAHAALEGALHVRFAHLRTRAKGEWFRLEPDLIAFIQAIRRGANPVGLLFEDPRVILGWHLQPSPRSVEPPEATIPCPAAETL